MLSDKLIHFARRKSIDRISSRSFIATRDVPYKQSYRVSKWGIFYETKYRWNYRKEVKILFVGKIFQPRERGKIDSIEFFSTQYYSTYRIDVHCCEGYVLKENVCVPVCTPSCLNSQCLPNNYCECNQGYVKHTENECLPYCKNCVNGKCVAPGVCQCDFGYQMDKNNICKPVCTENCEKQHAYCSSPGTCTCYIGYQRINHVCIVEY